MDEARMKRLENEHDTLRSQFRRVQRRMQEEGQAAQAIIAALTQVVEDQATTIQQLEERVEDLESK